MADQYDVWNEQYSAACELRRPCIQFGPLQISIDGNKWCVLYGENLQDGVAGFGDSPGLAMWDFDKNWVTKLKPKECINATEGSKANSKEGS